jgi:hypothetical protein
MVGQSGGSTAALDEAGMVQGLVEATREGGV